MSRAKLFLLPALILLLCGCAVRRAATPALATPGPAQQTQIRGLFRGEGEPAEVVVLDTEHGYWAYRTDTLGIAAEFYEDELSGGTVSWCMAEIAWRDEDPLRTADAAADDSVLYMPETRRLTLIEDGAILAADGALLQRAGYGRLPDGGYVAIAISGCYEGESPGVSAEELAGLFLAAGCESAVQLAEGPAAVMLFLGEQITDSIDGRTAAADAGIAWGRIAN